MDLDFNAICMTFDVEWASNDVIDDVRSLLDERGIRGTFFVTHAGVEVPGHERALHPNFRRNGETYRSLHDASSKSDAAIHEHVIRHTASFAPEAKGVRSHSLYFDSSLLPLYKSCGIEYDSTYRLELVDGLRPFWKQHGIVEIPTYYADYFDLVSATTGFNVSALHLDRPGLKVLDFHPNLIFINASTEEAYNATRPFYHDPGMLRKARYGGRGTRTLFVEVLEYIHDHGLPAYTMGEINSEWRARHPAK